VHFPEGEAGTHQFWNETAEPVRILLGSSKSSLYLAGYPDSSKLFVIVSGGERRMVRDSPELDYWDGE
jgi:uncharacterized cupin superfamily protein